MIQKTIAGYTDKHADNCYFAPIQVHESEYGSLYILEEDEEEGFVILGREQALALFEILKRWPGNVQTRNTYLFAALVLSNTIWFIAWWLCYGQG